MIHAYLFVQNIHEKNGGHGPNFHHLMHSINKVCGTNITVYHTFSDEVEHYKQHVWRCNGICKNRKPFYGYVKRTSNRAPAANDLWWASHRDSCSGTFVKIAEPELKKKPPKPEPKKKPTIKDWAIPISPNKRFVKKSPPRDPTTPKNVPDNFIILRDLNKHGESLHIHRPPLIFDLNRSPNRIVLNVPQNRCFYLFNFRLPRSKGQYKN